MAKDTTKAAMLPAITLPDYDYEQKRKNEERSEAKFRKQGVSRGYPCIVCGTFTGPNPTKYVHVCGGGGEVHDARELADPSHDESGCLASYPIGASCLKRFPALRPYAFVPEVK